MIDIQVFQDTGPIVNGRGTPIEVTNWNMKNSGSYTTAYFPTSESASAPLIRPLVDGTQTVSYKVFTFFKLSGSYSKIKNLRFRVSLATAAGSTSDTLVYYKNTNVYEAPNNQLDTSMILLANKNVISQTAPIYPMISTIGPHVATTRQPVYTDGATLYTNYFVTQLRVNKGSGIGNTAELELKFEAYEYGDF